MPQLANHKKVNPLWFSGICDELLMKVAIWDKAYWQGGEVHSTRKWLNPASGQVENKPTRMAHSIPIRETELDHLIRIVDTVQPDTPLAKELKDLKAIWKYGKPVKGNRYMKSYWSVVPLPVGLHRVITACFYPEHVKQILSILTETKTGQKSDALEAQINEAKQAGKDIFEE